MERLADITRDMIAHLEKAIDLNNQGLLDEANPLAKTYARLFGSKHSYVDILTELSVLMIKIHTTNQSFDKKASVANAPANSVVDRHDVALIRAFLERQKHYQLPIELTSK